MQRERLQVRMLASVGWGGRVSHIVVWGLQEAKQALREAEDRLENRKKGHTMNAKAWAAAAQSSAQRRALELLNRQRVWFCCLAVGLVVCITNSAVLSLFLALSTVSQAVIDRQERNIRALEEYHRTESAIYSAFLAST